MTNVFTNLFSPAAREKNRLSPQQVRGLENPFTAVMHPVVLGSGVEWWSHDQILVGGLKVDGPVGASPAHALIGYAPTPIPRSWGEREFVVALEYEVGSGQVDKTPHVEKPALSPRFKFRIFYGCGDPSEIHLGETAFLLGHSGKKDRLRFRLDESHIQRNELFRATIDVVRDSQDPVLVYGAWLELRLE